MQVWAQLGEMFGKAFYREHGQEPTPLWVGAVDRLPDQLIKNGLANLGNDGLGFPPNLSQFVAACKRQKPVRQLGVKLLALTEDEERKNADKAWDNMEKLVGRKLRPE